MSDIVGGTFGMIGGMMGAQQANKEKGFASRGLAESDPWGPYRHEYANQLEGLMNNPSSITKMPGYQFQFDQGEKAVDRSMAAKGFLGSGNEAAALTQYGQGFAQNFFQQQEQMLAGLAGVQMQPQLGAAMQGYSSGVGHYMDSMEAIASGAGKTASGISMLGMGG